MSDNKKTLALIILDGWGHREAAANNAITLANTPVMDSLWHKHTSTLISGSGQDVGLPDGQMGNSEVGHINLGSGRVVYQELTRIGKAIEEGTFQQNPALTGAIDQAVAAGKAVHLMGLLSPGGVHSHESHIEAAVKLAAARGAKQVYLHAFLDGRDTPPRSAEASLAKFETLFEQLDCGRVASVVGRYYAMDRDNRWERVEKAYQLLTEGKAEHVFERSVDALNAAYARDENDEFVAPSVIATEQQPAASINDGDALIFMNFRADRAREITRSFVQDDFDGFTRAKRPALADFVMLTQYAADIQASCAYPPETLTNTLGEVLQNTGKTQLRISETEKYAHVTFFFNGGVEEVFEGEQRKLIPSPKVATYDLQPEMNSELLTDELVGAIDSGEFDVIICNYPNGDMVGHTGNLDAAILACEAVDRSIGRVVEALERNNAEALITADHGNAEQMTSEATGQAHTAHTSQPVPLIYVGRDAKILHQDGRLSDIAPTMLTLMGVEVPDEMTGRPLFAVTA
ncbi:2,3-bisphosphoglycerate-independent phosphoglycerate mutase [Paraferrimonas sedimenticola]|uniref:2,3-bisphosphoglycerate-independent phosphoglycerate mutase n=1 Tax=Paraferrimonas sedimenticola TaxID=375674 RepID=A0AA37RYT9_9GAMM|nr:2,3-bisphosphoglycerate-independent phosphoglycerate mutase [Paraferrimonas sedimenticola]GLP97773.1 2,3-bisphosphoglycerate-independent phosphoglycerate mutase [Paraferrimonas sedimenticola]